MKQLIPLMLLSVSIAPASVLGILDLSAGANTITLTANTLTSSGDFTTSTSTTLTYGAGLLVAAGTQGVLENFPPTTEPNFLTFLTIPSLAFDLGAINPGSANTICTGLAIGDSCSPTAGSPFLLTDTPVGTEVSLTADGTAVDGTFPISDWIGSLSVPVTGLTPAQLQAILIAPGGSFTSPYAAEFVVTLESPVPETPTGVMIALGCLSLCFPFKKSVDLIKAAQVGIVDGTGDQQ